MRRTHPNSIKRQASRRGFTLTEMLVVIGIMFSMLGLLGVSMSSLNQQGARQGAVDLILNTFEQARVEALRASVPVYVGFADKDYGVSADRYRAFIVFRDRIESDPPVPVASPAASPAPPAAAPKYLPLTKWKKLPDGISFKSSGSALLGASAYRVTITSADTIPNLRTGDLPVLMFNQTGAIQQPAASGLTLFIYEGYYDGTKDVPTANSSGSLFEAFTFSRFTGRIRHEVSTLTP